MKTKKTAPKMSGLVVAALRNLRDAHGSTAKEIMKYIMAEYNASEATVQRQLKTALKRGVEYGILKRTNAGYSLNTDAEVIGPLDLAQMDACGKKKKRMSCKPKRKACGGKKKKAKRSCGKKRKRASCGGKKRKPKKNPCGMCAARGRRGDCSRPAVQLVREGSPSLDGEATSRNGAEADKLSLADDEHEQSGRASSRSRSTSRSKQQRSRSQSLARSGRYSGSEMDDERQDDE